mmetsp:Transcript_128411/g.222629  ORF Transcript_128411/g.222629 Transcript_128411/m.222629 type:complete len:112 (-) Transcript_128411:317-652(-)
MSSYTRLSASRGSADAQMQSSTLSSARRRPPGAVEVEPSRAPTTELFNVNTADYIGGKADAAGAGVQQGPGSSAGDPAHALEHCNSRDRAMSISIRADRECDSQVRGSSQA